MARNRTPVKKKSRAPATPGARSVTIEVPLEELNDVRSVSARLERALGVKPDEMPPVTLSKRSLDARHGRVAYRLVYDVDPPGAADLGAPHPRTVERTEPVVVVGDGPAGLFCAYELARAGVAATVLDRGLPVQPRRKSLKGLNRHGRVDRNSNYCFGEGGAGTYSDGKLYTRATKRGDTRDVLEILVRHGAPAEILVDARPHIGSNRLPGVVAALRQTLTDVGVEFLFGARLVELLTDPKGAVRGVRLADGAELDARYVVLATGHSAGDVFELLDERGVLLEPKAFAVGVRIEHPQPLIDSIQYGRVAGHSALPRAAYRLSTTVGERGVFSFCMCPGGWIVPASTEPGGLVVNGMSLSRRNSPFANSGLVVTVEPADLARAGFGARRGGVAFQRVLERRAFEAGGGLLQAPATRVTDFVRGRGSSTVPDSSYVPGLAASDIGDVFDGVGLDLASALRAALPRFEQRMRGYLTAEAVLVGVESRTSSPVRVVRNPESLESPSAAGLYPCGEGAGYAGGILSAAMDGMRVARKVAARVTRSRHAVRPSG